MDSNKELYIFIGDSIRAHRLQAGLTQGVLAQKLGVTRNSISMIEKGQQGILTHTLLAIAKTLDVPLSSLLPPETEPQKLKCDLCGFDYTEVYGELSKRFTGPGNIGPRTKSRGRMSKEGDSADTVLCDNCRSVLKLNQELTLNDFKKRIQQNRRRNLKGGTSAGSLGITR